MTNSRLQKILSTLPPEQEIYMEWGELDELYPVSQVIWKENYKKTVVVLSPEDYAHDETWSRRPDLVQTVIAPEVME